MTPPERAPGAKRMLGRTVAASQLIVPALLVAYLVGSLLLTGGNVVPGGSPNWDELYRSPVFPVPAWLVIVPAAVGTPAVIGFAALSNYLDAPRLNGFLGYVLATGVSSFIFFLLLSGAAPEESGLLVSGYGVALCFAAASVLVVGVALAVQIPPYERHRRAGTLPAERAGAR